KDDKQIEYVTYIQESARNMLSLVNSLLDWTRLQTGRISFEPERINAGSIITKSIQMLSGAALQKNINLVSDIEEEVYVHADENLLLQVFNNIVSNAIKFTKDGGSIVISAMPLASKIEVQFKVKDSGIGIKEEDIQKLFSVDSKYTTEGTSGEKGSGLGLSLCKEIVLKHGGEISVNSEYGKGTEFLFTIPISSMKILLVDDTATDRILYSKLLKSIIPDYKIEEASNGEEAFDIIKYGAPALVITDHDMPKMSGYELVQTVRKSELKFKPPIMILSSDINDSIIEEYHELGVEYAFNKPVDLTIFKFAIEKSLKKALIS
ncbi:MAG: hybrid sensor histidine kinase/response regulator, partial [Melioribacteraceae bacterium]|nr:hybrid sensor histidine kinase/response regulator [Melioribacteraceae bacterium]